MEAGVRWSLTRAATEFGCAIETLKRGLKQHALGPAEEDGKFSTAQICTALFGDLNGEKVRLTRAQADKAETENRIAAGELIDVSAALELAQRFCFAARQVVMMSALTEAEKNRILKEFGRLGEMDFNQIEVKDEVA